MDLAREMIVAEFIGVSNEGNRHAERRRLDGKDFTYGL